MAPSWRPSRPDWLTFEVLFDALFLATCPATLRFFWQSPWRKVACSTILGGVILEAGALFLNTKLLWRSPRLQLTNLAGNAVAVNAIRRGRVKHLRGSSKLLADVFGCLPRNDVDECQLVCRSWMECVVEHAKQLSLRLLGVWLLPRPYVIWYRARCRRGSVEGAFFNGLRSCDKPYFRNTALHVRTYGIFGVDRSSTKVIRMVFDETLLAECNIRISSLHVDVRARELPEIFHVAKNCSARYLKLSYPLDIWEMSEEELTRFFAAVFRESGVHLKPLSVSIEHLRFNSCSAATKVGRMLLTKLMHYDLDPGPENLAVCMPKMGGLQFIRLLMENFTEDTVLPADLRVVFPSRITLAQLWPANLDYFDDVRGRWVVTAGSRRLIMHANSYRERRGITIYKFTLEWSFSAD